MSNLLSQITSPNDIKCLQKAEIQQLTDGIRGKILRMVSVCGGHPASNLGTVELTVALHRFFSCLDDIFVWDVGHQAHTHKEKDYRITENNPVDFHGTDPFDVQNGETKKSIVSTFNIVFGHHLCKRAHKKLEIVTVTARLMAGSGLTPFKQASPTRFFDVGIAEVHIATFVAGLVVSGLQLIVSIYSIIHDVALQDLPMIFAIDGAGAVPADGEIHQGFYDISLLRATPNLMLFAPASETELTAMLDWSFEQSHPVAIRYPKSYIPLEKSAFLSSLKLGRGGFSFSTPTTIMGFADCVYEQGTRDKIVEDAEFSATAIAQDIYDAIKEHSPQQLSMKGRTDRNRV